MAEGGNPFTTMVSCKWLVVIGVLTIAISLVAGIILGVIAVHFSNATAAKSSSSTTDEFMSASAGAQQMELTTTGLPDITSTLSIISSTEKHDERDVPSLEPVTQPIDSPTTISTEKVSTNTTEPSKNATAVNSMTPPMTAATIPSTNSATTPSTTTTKNPSTTTTTTVRSTMKSDATNATTSNEAMEGRDLTRTPSSTTTILPTENGSATLKTSQASSSLTAGSSTTTLLVTTKPTQPPDSPASNVIFTDGDLFSTRPFWLINTNTTATTNVSALPTSTPTANVSSSNIITTNNSTNSSPTASSTFTETFTRGTTATSITTTKKIEDPLTTNAVSLPSTTVSTASVPVNSTPTMNNSANLKAEATKNPSIESNNTTDFPLTPVLNSTANPTTITSNSSTESPVLHSTENSTTIASNLSTGSPLTTPLPQTVIANVSILGNSTGDNNSSSVGSATSTVKPTPDSTNLNTSIDNEETEVDILALEEPTHPCPGSPNITIFSEQICDGKVHCPDATDETNCSCRSRVDPSKVCDGVFDCPFLDDETGCRGCNSTQFTCDITRLRPLCIPLKQRCDGVEQCPDGMDEVGCSILSPSEYPFEISVPKYSSGYVMRNMKNKWYPICGPGPKNNITDLVSGICQLTVGDSLGEAQISKRMANSKFYSGQYIGFTDIPNRPFTLVDTCLELLFVQCPPPRCGRKAPSQSEVGRKMTTRSISTTAATTTARTPFSAPKDTNITNGSLVNPTPSTKPQGLLHGMFQNLLSTLQLTGPTSINSELNPALLKRVRKSDSSRQSSSRRNRLSGRFVNVSIRRRVRTRRGTLNRIVGGRESNVGAWPWTVAITRDGESHCGGSLLNSNWILTAGHCLHSLEKYHYEIQLGMLRRSSYSPLEQTRAVFAAYVHHKYDPFTLDNDIALLQVQEPFDLNQWTAPACLPHPTYSPSNSTNCTVVGWGNVQENGPESDALREVVVPIAPCKSDIHIDPKKVLCAGYPDGKKDACQGDSGGPLVCPDPSTVGHWILAGIVSFGAGCARPGELGAYTNVAYHLDWINDILGGNTSQPKKIPKQECAGMVCRRGTGVCLAPNLICDGYVDCLNAEDEVNCSANTKLLPTNHVPIVTTNTPILTTTPLPAPVVCSENQFTCTKTFQCVDKSEKCDGFRDCSDGTDESYCSCADYLKGTGQAQLICDDHIDCWDHSDEVGCRNCSVGEYYSLMSSQCLPNNQLCDDKLQAKHGDDESHCLTLVPRSNSITLDRAGRPKREPSGVVAINQFGLWKPICAQNWSSSLSDQICSFSGYGPSLSFSLIPGLKATSLKTFEPSEGFLWNTFKPSNRTTRDISNFDYAPVTSRLHSIVKRQTMNTSTPASCKFVNLTCGSQLCGIRPSLGGWDDLPNIEGRFPWQTTLFLKGEYLCGATLIAPEWLLVSANCSRNFNLTVDYVSALMGVRRFTPFASPTEQIRRVANSVKISSTSKIVLLFLERPVELTEHVNPVCVASQEKVRTLIKKNKCAAVGRNGTLLASSASFSSINIATISTLSVNWINNETISCPSNKLSGSVVCSDGSTWHAIATFERDCSKKGPFNDTLEGIWRHTDAISNIINCKSSGLKLQRRKKRQLSCPVPTLPAPTCPSWRCPLGSCLQTNEVCDGVPDCRDQSDELGACIKKDNITTTPFLNATRCAWDQFECSDSTCIPGNFLCDGVVDCPDGQDEKAPFEDLVCPLDVFRCLAPGQNRSQEMISMEAVCDGAKNCSNGMDEYATNCVTISAEFPVSVDTYGNPKKLSMAGFLAARVQGRWFPYCANEWSDGHTKATCKTFGFHQKATFQNITLPVAKDSGQCSSVVFLKCA